VGDEVGEEGTPHLQIYIYFVNGRTFNRMKRDFPRAHIEVARGSPEENREYCSKENVMIERGNIPTQGRRSDIIAYIELIKSGRSEREVATAMPEVWGRMEKLYDRTRLLFEEPRSWETKVYIFYGDSGSGKTHAAVEAGGTFVEFTCSGFFLNYDGEDIVIFDEFNPDIMPIGTFLRMTDKYAYTINVKGAKRNWKPRVIYITTNDLNPQNWYGGATEFRRRITEFRRFRK
jgi:hypothetical protein